MDLDKESRQNAEALLQFQDFGTSSMPSVGMQQPPYEHTHNFSAFPSSQIDIDDDNEEIEQGAALMGATSSSTTGGHSLWSLGYYQNLFNVDTDQVKDRLLSSFVPRRSRNFLAHCIRPSPDLYGPFWVCVTLVFCIAIMGNIADYLQAGGEGQHWRYDFRKVSISASTIFSYALFLPLLLWLLLWWRKGSEEVSLTFVEIVCLYGYSLAIYIPISILWTIPVPLLQWLLVLFGATLSGSVLVLSLWQAIVSSHKKMAFAVVASVLLCHLLLAAGLQLYFFRYSGEQAVVEDRNTTALRLVGDKADVHKPLASMNLLAEIASAAPSSEAPKTLVPSTSGVLHSANASASSSLSEKQTLKVTVSLPSAASTDKVGGGTLVRTVQNNTNHVLPKE